VVDSYRTVGQEIVDELRSEDEGSAYNLAGRVVDGDRDVAILTILQLAAQIASADVKPWSAPNDLRSS